MTFRAMDAGCGGVDDFGNGDCPGPVTLVGLYAATNNSVWQSFACDGHAHQLIAPRPLLLRDREVLRRREDRSRDERIGRRYAGEQDGPLARGADATKLLRRAIEWSKRHPLHPTKTTDLPSHQHVQRRLTVAELADELFVDPGDIEVLLTNLDPDNRGRHPDGTILTEYGAAIRDQIDHLCERTVPAYWWPGSDPEAGTGATKMR